MKVETLQEAKERLNLRPGDKVKVLSKANSRENGWANSWTHDMDQYIGLIGTVTFEDNVRGVDIHFGNSKLLDYCFPHFVLEKIEEEKEYIQQKPASVKMDDKKPMTVLEEAQSLIYGDREQDYGKTSDNFADIAKGWEVITKTSITPEQVALMMAWLKICRANKDNCEKRDSYVDLAGYAGCIEKIKKGI
jgi:hypothetical protein